jgi:secreted trypsin-like serine protease
MLAAGLALAAVGPAAFAQTPMIVGGQPVGPGEYTATVALRNKSSHFAFCTGAVVADYWVLTAKHCIAPPGAPRRDLATFSISLGRLEREGVSAIVVGAVVHRHYDVALLRSDTKLTSSTVSAARVSDQPLTEDSVTLVGWGFTKIPNGAPATQSMKLDLKVAPCPTETSSNFFCTSSKGMKGLVPPNTRPGDSGGPAFIGPPGSPTLVGVIAGAPTGPTHYSQTVITKSAKFYSWLQRNIR